MGDILNRKAVKYIIAKPQEAFIEENEEKLKVERIEIGRSQIIRYMIVKLTRNIKCIKKYEISSKPVRCTDFFIIDYFFSWSIIRACRNIQYNFEVGTQLSSLLGGIGALVAIVTAYLNKTTQKYYESSGVKEIDENTFKPMYLNIEDKVIKQFVKHLKGDAFYNEFAKRKTNRKTNGIRMNLRMKKMRKK
ncbi:hypothetical protein F8M41_011738 [Gigaspora margarita]|uniref:Uncharacterized protein n=1 Tax=Gigaspora margarita TaxID=4874 RepID=A0A8H4EUW7_GIGMA|nr:hypothetical protein F8M41_011738 [Gigaspora margarita]